MAGDVLLLPGGNGHLSASQRKIARLEAAREHFISIIAVLTTQLGGTACIPRDSLVRQYDLGLKEDDEGTLWCTAAPRPTTPDVPAPLAEEKPQ